MFVLKMAKLKFNTLIFKLPVQMRIKDAPRPCNLLNIFVLHVEDNTIRKLMSISYSLIYGKFEAIEACWDSFGHYRKC